MAEAEAFKQSEPITTGQQQIILLPGATAAMAEINAKRKVENQKVSQEVEAPEVQERDLENNQSSQPKGKHLDKKLTHSEVVRARPSSGYLRAVTNGTERVKSIFQPSASFLKQKVQEKKEELEKSTKEIPDEEDLDI